MKRFLQYTMMFSLISSMPLGLSAHAQELSSAPASGQTAPMINPQQNVTRVVEVAFVLDTTGSMTHLIEGAKKKIWSIANTIIDIDPQATIRISLIAYRDVSDDYVVNITHPMDEDVQSMYSALLKLEADGGGDTPESVNQALNNAVNSLQWSRKSPDTKQIIFLVGDAPPHMDYREKKYPEIIQEAVQKGIIVNTVQAGNNRETRKVWHRIATIGNGDYVKIPQSGGSVEQIPTPYDDAILQTQKALDKTVILYGSKERQSEMESKMATRDSASAETRADNASFYSKKRGSYGSYGSKSVISGQGDLLSDSKSGLVKLEAVQDDHLPPNMRGKSLAEKQAIIDASEAERKVTEGKMLELVKQRDAYISKQAHSAPADSFDSKVKSTLKEQLK